MDEGVVTQFVSDDSGWQPSAAAGKQMAHGSGVSEKIVNHCRSFASECVFVSSFAACVWR